MAYANLPPSLQQMFQDYSDRLTKLENASRFSNPVTPPLTSQPTITGLGTGDPTYPRAGDQWLNQASNVVRYVDALGVTQQVTPASFAGPVTSNKIINGNFQINQRDPSNAGVNSSINPIHDYYWDRWYCFIDEQGLGATTAYTETYATQPVGLGLKYGENAASVYAFSSDDDTTVPANAWFDTVQLIEQQNLTDLLGQKVTVSLRLAGKTSPNVTVSIVWTNQTAFNTDMAASWTTIASQTLTPTTALAKYSFTTTLPSSYTSGTFGIRILATGQFYVKKQIWFTDVQLEKGSVASQYVYAGGSIGGELMLCQRYYQILQATGIVAGFPGAFVASNRFRAVIPSPVIQRTIPTITSTGGELIYTTAGVNAAFTGNPLNYAQELGSIIVGYAVTGAVVNTPGTLVVPSGWAMGFNAEL